MLVDLTGESFGEYSGECKSILLGEEDEDTTDKSRCVTFEILSSFDSLVCLCSSSLDTCSMKGIDWTI